MKDFRKKRLIAFVTLLTLLFTMIPTFSGIASAPAMQLLVNNAAIETQPTVYKIGNATMLPLKSTALALGYMVSYNAYDNSVKLVKDKETAIVYLGKNQYVQNGKSAIKLSAAASAIRGQSTVPVDFFKTVLNCGIQTNNTEIKLFQNPILKNIDATIAVNVGDSFSVELSENSSTGYAWSFTTPAEGPSLISLVNITPNNNTGTIGVLNTKNWLFKAQKAGTYTLTFESKKSGSVSASTYKYTIVVSNRTSGSPDNVFHGTLNMNKNDRFTVTLPENAAVGYSWTDSGIPKSTMVTTTTTTTRTAVTGDAIKLPDGTTTDAAVGTTITDTAISTSGGTAGISLVSRSTALNTGIEGIVGEPTLRMMNFNARRSGDYHLILEYNKSFAKEANPKTITYAIKVL